MFQFQKNMKFISFFIITTVLVLGLFQACTKDKLIDTFQCENEIITFENEIKFILEGSCGAGTTQCHVPGGFFPDYTSWSDEMLITLNNNRFNERVVSAGDMPPVDSPESAFLDSLEFYKIRCWIEGGYLKE